MTVTDNGDTLPKESGAETVSNAIETTPVSLRRGYRRKIVGDPAIKPFRQNQIRRRARVVHADLSEVPITDMEVMALLLVLKSQCVAILKTK